jgi:hypothetical protein
MKPPHSGDLVLGVVDESRVRGLLRLEDGIDALGWNDRLVLVCKDEGGVLTVEDDDVDLFAEISSAVDYMSLSGL